MKVVGIGTGYVGLVVEVRAAEVGHTVFGVDVDRNKIDSLNNFSSYIEDVTDEQLRAVSGNFKAIHADDIAEVGGFDVGFIAVPTPVHDGVPDLSYVVNGGRILASQMQGGEVIVLESTTYPGTTDTLLANTIFEVSGLRAGVDYHLGYSSERIDPGNKVHTFQTTPKLVSGTTPEALAAVKAFYDTLVDRTVPVSSTRAAELCKVWENASAAMNIAAVMELAQVCDLLEIDVNEVIEAAFTKGHSMGDHPWYPSIGYGGHCLPEDPLYLNWLMKTKFGKSVGFIEHADSVNSQMPHYVVSRAQDMLNDRGMAMKGSRILLMGLSYKPDTADMRKSKSIDVLNILQSKGAVVDVCEPHISEYPGVAMNNEMTGVEDYDLVFIATAHSEFDLNKLGEVAKQVFDTRHVMAPAANVVYL
jgi:UDP-N-acetyl-D-glucosamine dehydrogenase